MSSGIKSILVLYFLTSFSCTSGRFNRQLVLPASIVDKDWLLLAVKDNGRTIKFSQDPDSCFTVRFSNKRFKGWNGSFFITGISKDSASSYFLPSPLMGYYSIKPENKIGLYWFSNTSWAMHFDYSSNSKLLQRAFRVEGTYVSDQEKLYLINGSMDLNHKDTVLVFSKI